MNISSGAEIPGSADTDFDKGCKIIYDFISQELDEAVTDLMKEDGSGKTRNRMNQAANRMIKMRLLLNSEVFIKQNSYNAVSYTHLGDGYHLVALILVYFEEALVPLLINKVNEV